jgi:hypothetical protein
VERSDTHQQRPDTAMGFAALYPSYGPIMPVDPRDIENGMKLAPPGWHDIRISIFAAYLSLEIKWAKS